VAVVLGLAIDLIAEAPPLNGRLLTARIDEQRTAILDQEEEVVLVVRPHKGDAWTRLALRTTGNASLWKEIAAVNGIGGNLPTDRDVRIPFSMLKPSLQLQVIQALFPDDRPTEKGWMHKVVLRQSIEGESYWKIAEWFTGDGANYAAIRSVNSTTRLSTRPGEIVVIPRNLLSPAFKTAPEARAEKKMRLPSQVEDDPQHDETAAENAAARLPTSAGTTANMVAASKDFTLEYERGSERPYAIYRLRRGEALYSSVAIRFTGRLYAKDVNEVVQQIVEFNGIGDVARIPVDYKVRIPMELLAAEFRPLSDPRRLEREQSKRESLKLAKKVGARNLEGVHIVIDAGHGGRDVGTSHEGIWESTYVYDIACRLKKLLESESAATVHMTTRSRQSGYSISSANTIKSKNDHVVLTTPNYILEDPTVGVNLRWYLANSIFRRTLEKKFEEEKVIFLSIHADSLHPSLRGAMAYIPGARLARGNFEKRGAVYLARSEVRESPLVSISRDDALRSEGLSMRLAEALIESFDENKLGVHPFSPIRDNVVRDGKEWVPAVIRYNKIPTRVLLEVCNLGNLEDRKQMLTGKYREQVASAIYEGLAGYFDGADSREIERAARTAAR